ncbi:alpha/beta fold hydrolase [Gilvibacter sediminis]|uniref:alpha/beta fold hydrolase n=1 Tax=Gilvibacter sediminis TaxID=379071 RepID=UPI002350D3EF|nr:alpha/beta hydrolase [Gilvibacter sediminis]MDC7998943.1 alpha/beta hydrolase [Gilvibacter sediminis]
MKRIALIIALIFSSISLAQQEAIKIEVQGSGDPILLIPGFTVPGSSWESTVAHLSQNFECHIVTLAGFGGLEPIDFPWLPQVNDSLEHYIQTNELNGLTIIGHSLGGAVGTWLASRPDNSVEQLILVDALPAAGALMIPNYDPDVLVYDSPYNNQQLAMSDTEFAQMAAMMASGMSLNAETQQQIKNWILEADRKTYVYGYTDYLKLDLREDLKNIRAEVTIIAADQPYGKQVITQTYEGQYANLSAYDLRIAENSAHFVMFDQPEWFQNQLEDLLSRGE